MPARCSLTQGFYNSLGLKTKELSERRVRIACWTWGPGDCISKTAMKDRINSYYTMAERANELHNLTSSHHRADEKGVHMPVGDNSKVEG